MSISPAQAQANQVTDPYIPLQREGTEVRWTVQTYGRTDRGRVRPSNEDQFLIAQLTKALQVQQTSLPQSSVQYGDERGYLFVVADGMGGHQAGEQASALAVDLIEQFILNTLKWVLCLQGSAGQTLLAEFHAALQQTDARICKEAGQHPELWGMGSTLTLAYSFASDLFIAHVGDSRCYLFRAGELHQLTCDHTLVQEMVSRGYLKREEAAQHRLRHVITNVLGSTEAGVKPEVHKLRVDPGDVLLLCSDGLTEMVSDEQISVALQKEKDIRRVGEQLVALANGKGGKDNVTVVLARYDHSPA